MPTSWSLQPQSAFLILAILMALLGFMSFVSCLVTARHRRVLNSVFGGTLALVLFLVALLFGTISIGLQGYAALTREDVIVEVTTIPTGEQTFEAHFVFPDGREETFELAGDQLYVDAHVLKWKPIANLFGLHTQFALDRVTGRYEELEDERTLPRTVHSLGGDSKLDLYRLRQRWDKLSPLYDTAYGSATWTDAQSEARFELRVSTSGLLIRPAPAPGEKG